MNSTKSIAALFDFDGVVMDTETQYSIFWNEQGRKYHPELPEFGRLIKGQTLTQIYANYFAGMEEVQHEITEDLNKFEKTTDKIIIMNNGFNKVHNTPRTDRLYLIFTSLATSSSSSGRNLLKFCK